MALNAVLGKIPNEDVQHHIRIAHAVVLQQLQVVVGEDCGVVLDALYGELGGWGGTRSLGRKGTAKNE